MNPQENEPRLDPQELVALARRLQRDPAFITRLYEASEMFREICGDYATCQETLERFRRLGRVDHVRIDDYVEMRDQLERELRGCLEKRARKDE